MIALLDRSTWTADGPVDLVAIDRWIAGDDLHLTEAEEAVVVHMLTAAGWGPATLAGRLHRNTREIRATLTQPAPVDRLGRPFHLTA